MTIVEIILLSIALGLDAFSVALAAGAYFRKATAKQKFRLSFHFGLFQFLMPIIGWLAGEFLEGYINSFDHWIVFAILSIIAGKMLYDGTRKGDNIVHKDISKGFSLIALSLATSIDAMAIGFSLALIHQDIIIPSVFIGIIAAAMTLLGIKIGEKASKHLDGKALIFGAFVLIAIACKVLFEHLTMGL